MTHRPVKQATILAKGWFLAVVVVVRHHWEVTVQARNDQFGKKTD